MIAQLKWDSEEWRAERDEKLLGWMRGDANAVNCVVALSTASELWDDLIDKDRPVTEAEIHKGFISALILVNDNPFWQRFHVKLMPIVVVGTNAWLDANILQDAVLDRDRMMGFYIRNYAYEMTSMAAYCAGGWEWLRSISMEMRQFFQNNSYFHEIADLAGGQHA